MSIPNTGITSKTPGNILLGAGVWLRGLAYANNEWNGTILGATSGGCKVTIKGNIKDIELDGALVKVKGLAVMRGGTATAEVNFVELTGDMMKMAIIGETPASTDPDTVDGYTMIRPKKKIEDGDYIENFGFVGKTVKDNKDIIIIFDNALCTSGLEIEGKDDDKSVIKLIMEAYQDMDGDLEQLPVRIYFPTPEQG